MYFAPRNKERHASINSLKMGLLCFLLGACGSEIGTLDSDPNFETVGLAYSNTPVEIVHTPAPAPYVSANTNRFRYEGPPGGASSRGLGTFIPPAPSPQGLRDILGTNKFESYSTNNQTAPYVPPLRTTLDGRIGINVKARRRSTGSFVDFHLLKPESIKSFHGKLGAGIHLIDDALVRHENRRNPVTLSSLYDLGNPENPLNSDIFAHHTICDASTKVNPTQCDGKDCYQFSIIGAFARREPRSPTEVSSTAELLSLS